MDRDDVNNGSGEGLGMVMILSFKENSNEIKVNWYSTVKEQFYREKNQYTDTMELINKVNKKDLQTLYDECLTLKETDYTVESWTNLKTAMNKARNILDKVDVTQDEVDKAKMTLQNAKDTLIKVVIDSDKIALKIAIDLANEITDKDLENVVPLVVEEFKAAKKQAIKIYENENASQDEINDAFNRLASVMHKLEFYKGDKTLLKSFIDNVDSLDVTKYTEATWNTFETKLNDAVAVYNDENAMQEEVNSAYKELVTAFLNLRLIPDKSLLEDLINKAQELNAANYTKASYAVVENALENAKAVFDDPNVTQEQVDNAKDVLEKAINVLETNVTASVDNTVSTPVNSGDTTSVKTGDESLTEMFATIALLSVTGYTVLKRKED